LASDGLLQQASGVRRAAVTLSWGTGFTVREMLSGKRAAKNFVRGLGRKIGLQKT